MNLRFADKVRSMLRMIRNYDRVFAWLACLLLSGGQMRAVAEDHPPPNALTVFSQEFISITPGSNGFPSEFTMGSTNGPAAERPVHLVKMSEPFRISKYEVWQQLYREVMGTNPSRWKGPRNAAEGMTWQEAVEFCRKATQMMREQKLITATQTVRLPTEAEWEYCCRGGTNSKYSFGDRAHLPQETGLRAGRLSRFAWHTGNAAGNDPAVGVLKPNPWGLFDMHGYLREYCQDSWTPDYQNSPKISSLHVENSSGKCVVRGGSWKDPYTKLTSSYRQSWEKSARDDAVGFRCVLSRDDTDVRR